MSAHHLTPVLNPPHTSDRLLDSMQRWRDANSDPKPRSAFPGLRVIDAHRDIVELAKTALMQRYELSSLGAFAVLVHWSRLTHTPVPILAGTLVHGLYEADPWTVIRHRPLIRWLEEQLRRVDP